MKYLKVRVLPISGVGIFLIYICIFAGATVSGTPEIDFVVDIITYLCS